MKKIISFFLAIVLALTVVVAVPPVASADHENTCDYEYYYNGNSRYFWDHEEHDYNVWRVCGGLFYYNGISTEYYWYYGA